MFFKGVNGTYIMKLQKQVSRKTKDKTYVKWVITIPPNVIQEMGWDEGLELSKTISKNSLILSPKKNKIVKISTKAGKKTNYEKFMKIYFNLPLPERSQVIVVIEDKLITWDVAYKEISNKSELSEQILKKLEKLKII